MACASRSASIQSKIWKGYGKAARVIGTDYAFTRPSTGKLLLEDGSNLKLEDGQDLLTGGGATFVGSPLFTKPVSLNAEDMSYKKPNKYGKATWYALFDATGAEIGDYFVGAEGTFFIAAMQLMLPILVVECNRVVSIFRPQAQDGVGALAYGGTTEENQRLLVAGVPCSILQGTKGEKSEANLPGDTRSAWWTILMPGSVGKITPDDIIVDDLGQRYIISSNELTDLGYRITAMIAIA